ncbi:MAG: CehA/McbA family metallohydrolase [Candidatus Promineifilaceae bacterium]
MFDIAGNMHMHTPYSDGEKYHAEIAADAIKAGLDFIIVTDHNIWVDGVEGYYEDENGRVLLLVGEEVHDMRRQPQANHFLAYGANCELAPYAADPQRLINETVAAGGIGFLAHPNDPEAAILGENGLPLRWQNWDVTGFTGLEIWNYMSSFKGVLGTNKIQMVRAAFNPENHVVEPDKETLDKWDELLSRGKKISAVGNSDAHGTTFHLGPLSRVIFPYEFLFRAVNTHVLLREELDGELDHDKKLILEAIAKGNGWVGYDMAHPTSGFRFTGQSLTKGILGDEIKLDAGATLQVRAPAKCHIRLIHCGETIAEISNATNLTHIPIDPGAYRVECRISYNGRERGWIYSNPIYLI